MHLKNKLGKKMEILALDAIIFKTKELEGLINNNPTNGEERFVSLIPSEIFSSLFTEGEISSRRIIEELSSSLKVDDIANDKMVSAFFSVYNYLLKAPNFSISSFFNIYSLLSNGNIDKNSTLKDGKMFRDEPVYIGSNSMKREYSGFDADKIEQSLIDLCEYLNEEVEHTYDLYIKAIIGHLYFEMIHPYYDFNGRVGRLIPQWLFINNGKIEDLMFFSTAVGNYRETYLSLFRKTIDARTGKVNLDYFVNSILDLLILNQKQYKWYKNLETQYMNKSKKRFNLVQKNFIWSLMIKNEKQANVESFNTLDKDMQDYIERDLKQSQLSRDIKPLFEFKVIDKSDTKPLRYKLLNYSLLK